MWYWLVTSILVNLSFALSLVFASISIYGAVQVEVLEYDQVAWVSLAMGIFTFMATAGPYFAIRRCILPRAVNALEAGRGVLQRENRQGADDVTWLGFAKITHVILILVSIICTLCIIFTYTDIQGRENKGFYLALHVVHIMAAAAHLIIIFFFTYEDAEVIYQARMPNVVRPPALDHNIPMNQMQVQEAPRRMPNVVRPSAPDRNIHANQIQVREAQRRIDNTE